MAGFFQSLFNAVTGGPGHDRAFSRQVESIANRLGHRLSWSEDLANFCTLVIQLGAQLYFMHLYLTGSSVRLMVRSRIEGVAHGPQASAIAGALQQRSEELPWGCWESADDRFAVVSRIDLGDLTATALSNAIETMVGEVAHFDQSMYQHGYA